MYMEFGKTLFLMYATLLTPIVAGVINSLWCKSNYLLNLKRSIDAGKNFRDGTRIFGDHKTWKGLLGYVVLNAIFMVLFGILFDLLNWNKYSYIWQNHANTPLFNLWVGALIGLAYAVFELPNSFLKRRLDIKPGKSAHGFTKYFFTFLDQADSVFGVCLVVCIFYPMSIGFYLLYVLVGSVTHIIFNVLLYLAGLRKNML